MRKYYFIPILLLSLLVGCTTTPEPHQVTVKELVAVGNHEGLIQHYKAELVKTPDSSAVMLNLAQAYYDNRDVESAHFYVEQLKSQQAHQPSLYFLSGSIAADSSQFDMAISEFRKAESLGYPDSSLFIKLGIALTNSGRYKEAEVEFNQARLKGHDDIAVKNNLAVLYLAQGQYLQAVELLTPIYRQHPDEKKLAFNLAISLFKVGNYREAHRLLADDYSAEQVSALFYSLRRGEDNL
ncbi:tetratricopeptide repeat protein [Shewanella psychropiezotolerans]|uniref:Tetratricopeptide repeat protein n=1 Tax=Shewanella psychropiezotolerans TaxID=2593655 RepID=A0ABX5X386_9GAMM|nr:MULTISPECIES: tetratricopeptide repeat protein [Shewanella]MPY26139.1 tetratricopeptide repeat protein [Shewanella sp. YLB-07]QDO85808.1 tetratricopeptide repeat protein [Shewanella psychropiezotolerans]